MNMAMGHVVVSLVIMMAACGGSQAPASAPPANTARQAAPPPVEPPPPPPALDTPTHSVAESLTRMGLFRDAMCGCRDQPCLDELSAKMSRWGEATARQPGQEQPSATQQKEMERIVEDMTKCMTTVMTGHPNQSYTSAGATAGAATNTQASATSGADVVARMGQFRDAMCKCFDKPCADEVTEQMTRWGQELARSGGGTERVTEADTKAMAAVTEEMTQCMVTAMTANPQPPPPANKPAPPAKKPASTKKR